jgi:hypothetical protein
MNNIRKELTDLVETDNGDSWWRPEIFEKKILPKLPASLELLCLPPEYSKNYNCFVFMFGLENDPYFLGGNNPIQQEFVRHLIDKNLLIVSEIPVSGDFILYKNEKTGEITHGGILKSKDSVISKWSWGPTIRHSLSDVPDSYGDALLFFKAVTADVTKKEYQKYKDSGVYIKPIL